MDIEAIADVVVDAAKKTAAKATQPISKQIQSMNRSLKSAETISRQALEQADTIRQTLDENVDALEGNIQAVKSEHHKWMRTYAEAMAGLNLAQKELDSTVRYLPTSMEKQVAELREEFNKKSEQLTTLYSDLENTIVSRNRDWETTTKALMEKSEAALKEIWDSVHASVNTIQDGVKGDQGEPGQRGPKGDPGTMTSPERWLKEKLYRPGNTVIHRGGTWYCETPTVDEPGDNGAWTCLANGIDKSECFIEDGIYHIVMSDGSREELKIMPEHRGVWCPDSVYAKTDLVTNQYATYQAKVNAPSQEPGKKLPDGEEPEWITIAGRGPRGAKGAAGDPDDAAAIVYAKMQQDIAQGAEEMQAYLAGLTL